MATYKLNNAQLIILQAFLAKTSLESQPVLEKAREMNVEYFRVIIPTGEVYTFYMTPKVNRLVVDTGEKGLFISKFFPHEVKKYLTQLIKPADQPKKTCSNPFVEEDGFCSECLSFHFDAQDHRDKEPRQFGSFPSEDERWVDDLEGTDGFPKKIPQGRRKRHFLIG